MFQHLQILELSSVLAGPSVGLFFAELGAKVIKVENTRTGGDITRKWKLASEDKDENQLSAYYCSANWNKEVLFADFTKGEDRQRIYDLVKTSDIVIANFKHGADKKLGMDYETLKSFNSQLIYAQLTAFGAESKRTAFDVVLQAESGFMYMNGSPDGRPVKMPVALIDLLAAHQLKEGILVALLQRQETQKGALVCASLMESAIAALANQATNWLMGGHIPQRMGTLHPNIAPYGEMFETKDGKLLVLAIGNDKQFKNLCRVLQLKEVAKDTCFEDNAGRVKHRKTLQKLLQEPIAVHQREDLLLQLEKNEVPAGAVRNMQEVFELPIAQEMILKETMPNGQLTQRVKTVTFEVLGD
ncbi:MAG: CaiB/BaiF CoA transferase family protein [Chitinophagales bacterium]